MAVDGGLLDSGFFDSGFLALGVLLGFGVGEVAVGCCGLALGLTLSFFDCTGGGVGALAGRMARMLFLREKKRRKARMRIYGEVKAH